MPRGGIEPTIPVFERMKTVHALEGAATVIGNIGPKTYKIKLKDIKSHFTSRFGLA
jgi:hypothetical protein